MNYIFQSAFFFNHLFKLSCKLLFVTFAGFISLATNNLYGQETYLVLFKDKADSPFSVNEPEAFLTEAALERRRKQSIAINERDLPVNTAYLEAIELLGATIRFPTRWLNGAVISCNADVLEEIMGQSFVKGRWLKNGFSYVEAHNVQPLAYTQWREDLDYGGSFPQIHLLGIDQMHRQGFSGKGMKIAILDGGFFNLNQHPFLADLAVTDTYDFVAQEENVYDDHPHGLMVASLIGGYAPGILVSGAYEAEYCLYRTENAFVENKTEEMNALLALERADLQGVDIVNISLGYGLFFDDPEENYVYEEHINGDSALITIAAEYATSVGMLVVSSAGNDGNLLNWGNGGITTPGDGPNVLAVGAIDSGGNRPGWSSKGPTADGRLKPDVVAQGVGNVLAASNGGMTTGNGTSFAAPLVAGLAAGLWQHFPELTNLELLDLIRQSGDRVSSPNNQYGYGIPNFLRATGILTSLDDSPASAIKLYPNPIKGQEVRIDFGNSLVGKPYRLEVVSLNGQTVFSHQSVVKPKESLKLNNKLQPNNLYLFKFSIDGSVHLVRMLKQ